MGVDAKTLGAAKKYTDDSLAGAGAIKGVPCQIQSITDIEGGKRTTFLWEDKNGNEHTDNMDVMNGEKGERGIQGERGIPGPAGANGTNGTNGVGIQSMTINSENHLIVTYTNGTTEDVGVTSPGASITIDSALSTTSENPVQNKVLTNTLATKADLENGKVPQSQLPSFVDDVVDGYYKEADGKFYEESTYEHEITGESGKIYISVDTEIQYRWTGSAFSALGGALVLGETSSTAYRGDRGKIAYDDSQTNKGNIGTMSNLTTTEKGSLVGAINELKSTAVQLGETANSAFRGDHGKTAYNDSQTNKANIGTMSNLQTTEKGSLVGAINELKNSGGGGGGATYIAGDGINISEQNVISTENMEQGDMDEIVTPKPSIPARRIKYSTDEQVIGEWIDGKPLYQKTFELTNPAANWTPINIAGSENWENCRINLTSFTATNYKGSLPWYTASNNFGTIFIFRAASQTTWSFFINITEATIGSVSRVITTIEYTKTTD